jgi:hypothetical protein
MHPLPHHTFVLQVHRPLQPANAKLLCLECPAEKLMCVMLFVMASWKASIVHVNMSCTSPNSFSATAILTIE